MKNPSILWFRVDLRLSDNPALQKALELGKPILPIYILDDEDAENRKLGDASKWWLHSSLNKLSLELEKGLAPEPKTFTNLLGGKELTLVLRSESPVTEVL